MNRSPSAGPGRIVLATSFGFALVQLDVTVVNVALPRLGQQLGGGVSALQWIVDGYAIALAAALLSGGVVSDRIGSRAAYLTGLALFAAASAACGLAQGMGALIVARAVQGLGAAVMLPSSLALLNQGLPDPALRARAVGFWTAAGGCAITAGPIIGGLVLHALSWRVLFLLNIPICLLAGLLTLAQESAAQRPEGRRAWDMGGQLLAMLGLGALSAVVIEARPLGPASAPVLAGAAIAAAAILLFLRLEGRQAHPMLPLELFRRPGFAPAVAFGVIVNLTLYGVLFVLSLYFQRSLGYSPLKTGAAYLPLMGLVTVANAGSGWVVGRAGLRAPMTFGALAAAAGFLTLALLAVGGPYWRAVPAFVLISLGVGTAVPAMTTAVLQAVKPEASGLASGVLNAARQAGGAVGVALFGALAGDGAAQAAAGLQASSALAAGALVAAAVLAWIGLARTGTGAAGTGSPGRRRPNMSKPPPIPPEQRSFPDEPARDRLRSAQPGRRDEATGLQSAQPGDDDVNLKQQGRQGNIRQNTRNQGYQQDR